MKKGSIVDDLQRNMLVLKQHVNGRNKSISFYKDSTIVELEMYYL